MCLREGGKKGRNKTASLDTFETLASSTPVLSLGFLFVRLAHIASANITRRESLSTSEHVERECGARGREKLRR